MLNNVVSVFAPQGPPPTTNSYESIATVTVGGGGASSISFSSIPSTYKHLQIRSIMLQAGSGVGSEQVLRFNSDSGSNYAWHQLYGDGGSAAAAASASQTGIGFAWSPEGGTSYGGLVLDILDYTNTSKNTTTRSLNGWDRNGSGYMLFRSGLWMNTAAVTNITLTSTGANYSPNTQFALYGIKG